MEIPICAECRKECGQRRYGGGDWVSACHRASLIRKTESSGVSLPLPSASPPCLPSNSGSPRLPRLPTVPQSEKALEKYADDLKTEFRKAIVDELDAIGMDAREMAVRLKEALDICKAKKLMGVYARLLELWGEWVKVGGKNAGGVTGNTFNFIGTTDPVERQRLSSFVGILEAEARRRGLPGFLPTNSKAENSASLSGVVDVSGGEQTASDTGPS